MTFSGCDFGHKNERRMVMTNERMRQFALCWEVAATYVTKRVLHLAEIHDIEKKTGRLESERIPDTSLLAVYALQFPEDNTQKVTYLYVTKALRQYWNITPDVLEKQFQENAAKIRFRLIQCNDLVHEIKRARLMPSIPNPNARSRFKICRGMSMNRLIHNCDIAYMFTPHFLEDVREQFPDGCYLLLPGKSCCLIIEKTADLAEIQPLLEQTIDNRHRGYVLENNVIEIDNETGIFYYKIDLEHSTLCSFDEEGE